MRGAARLGDLTIHGGALGSGDPSVLINGRPAVRVGDMQVCPLHGPSPVVMGAPLVLVGNAPLARVLDLTMCIGGGPPGAGGGGAGGGGSDGPTARETRPGEGEAYLKRRRTETRMWIFKRETEQYVGRGKGKVDQLGGSGEGSVFEEVNVYKIGDVVIWETETKIGNVKGAHDGFIGESGTKKGFDVGGGVGADIVSTEHKTTPIWVDGLNELLKPTGYNVDLKVKGAAAAGVGGDARAHAYHDETDGRFHFGLKGALSALEGMGLGFEGSIGKSGGSGGAGAGALPNPIGTGSPDVLAG